MENQSKNNGMSIASLVLGISGCALAWFIPLVGIVCGIVGIILAVKGKKASAPGKTGMAVAGLVLSIISLSFGAISWACWMCAYCAADSVNDAIVNSSYYNY